MDEMSSLFNVEGNNFVTDKMTNHLYEKQQLSFHTLIETWRIPLSKAVESVD